MTPKEKAKELFDKFTQETTAYDCGDHTAAGINESILTMVKQSKRCALIAAKEVADNCYYPEDRNYWTAVIAEINNL